VPAFGARGGGVDRSIDKRVTGREHGGRGGDPGGSGERERQRRPAARLGEHEDEDSAGDRNRGSA
jgi:hypothetical protein